MSVLRKIVADRRMQWAIAVGGVMGIGVLMILWWMGYGMGDLKNGWVVMERFLMERPWLLFAGLVLLPGLPVPTSALMFLAGTVWRDTPVMACGLCILALSLNYTWTYWMAAGPMRQVVGKLAGMMEVKIPELPEGKDLEMILFLRLMPGVPLFLQNYLLGFLKVRFWLYLPVSILCNGAIACGIVLGGVGLADGRLMPVLTGGALIVVGVVALRAVGRSKSRRSKVGEGR